MLDPETLTATLYNRYLNGDLSRTLEKYQLKKLNVRLLWENPTREVHRWDITSSQYNRLNKVYEEMGLGELKDYMKHHRYLSAAATHAFTTGWWYSAFDHDLLGGDGTGKVLEALGESGVSIVTFNRIPLNR